MVAVDDVVRSLNRDLRREKGVVSVEPYEIPSRPPLLVVYVDDEHRERVRDRLGSEYRGFSLRYAHPSQLWRD